MKGIRNFLNFVEIGTKTASVIPFLVGAGYVLFRFGYLKPKQTLVFFAAMLLFDMTTTAINNHVGHRQTGRVPHYPAALSLVIIAGMGLAAAALGLYLVIIDWSAAGWQNAGAVWEAGASSGILILFVGLFCFAVGVLYSFGPLPIARTPFGELVSGTVMGVCIPFIVVQINRPLLELVWDYVRQDAPGHLGFIGLPLEVLAFVCLVIPLVCCIANIMLANNICDVEEDARVQRYTLPVYIGVKKSLRLYGFLYLTAYLFIALAALTRVVPLFTLAVLLTCIPVRKNILRFRKLQDKRQTFFTAVLNFLLICLPYAACLWLGGLLSIG